MGEVLSVDTGGKRGTIRLADGRTTPWTHHDVELADLRLAYVQHPFPAQGATTDTTHVIAGQHANRHGTYVALTRARHRTQIYTTQDRLDPEASSEPTTLVQALTDLLGRTEPDTPSLSTPLAHERKVDQLFLESQ